MRMKAYPREADCGKVRHFGFENELAIGAYSDAELSGEGRDAIYDTRILESIGFDGGGREFRTIPIATRTLKQVRGCRYVRQYYAVLKKEARVHSSGGTHIHISILDTDHESMEANAIALATAFFPQFQKIAGRKSHWAERPPRSNITAIRTHIKECNRYYGARKVGRSYHILTATSHQTLEFRGPKGSNDADEMLAWAEFLENVVKVANRKSVHGVRFEQLLKGERIGEYARKLRGERRITKADLRTSLNEKQLF